MRGDALAQLNVLTSMSNVQARETRASHQVFIDVPLQKESLSSLCGRQTRLSHHRQTMCPRLSHTIAPCVHKLRILNGRVLTDGRVLRSYARELKTVHKPTDTSAAMPSDVVQRPSQPIPQSC
jgi:hypothetical protein